MKGGTNNIKPDPEIEMANTDPEDFSTNQEAAVLPWFTGERKIALRWISPVYDQFTKEAPQERPGKK
jgi:hypothetical protein